jgi:hypothetical protein
VDLRRQLMSEVRTARVVIEGDGGSVELAPGRVYVTGPQGETGLGSSAAMMACFERGG